MGGASDNVDPFFVEELLSMLDKNNELIKAFRMARNRGRPNYITPSDEVVAFIVNDDTDTGGFRDTGTKGYYKRIPLINNKYSKIENLDDEDLDPDSTQRRHVSLREYYCYKIMIRTSEVLTPHLAGRLWKQYVVDQSAAIEQYRLDWVSTNQTTIRVDLYNSDSLAICRAIGHPSLFLTVTCNSKWPEIQEMLKLLPNVYHVDAPDIVSRVFKLKLDQLLYLIKKKNYFRKCIGVMHVIEFQKRGLPHVHMLIWLSPESRPNSIKKVDQFNGNTYFDDYGFPVYRRRNTGRVINKKGINLDNQFVVLYNRDLMLRFQCHINLEIYNSSRSLKYLFKYCLKGHDIAAMLLKNKSNKSGNEQTARSVKNLDEVKNFLDGRYVCASEASWKIFGFDNHHRSPSVERLPIHFPNQKYLNFQSSTDLENVCNNTTSKKSKLEAWFVANSEFPQAQNFTYSDFPTHFTWIKKLLNGSLDKEVMWLGG
ncbi:uncharacterized protein LOC141691939 [Apium graveolens]|uniref:uncharacterized protein LOC141691939 n=1 Tax=Apium graveolens TaxID=4045 RepID=UPI003D79DE11